MASNLTSGPLPFSAYATHPPIHRVLPLLSSAGETPPLAASRRHLVVLPLDSDFVVPQATTALRGLLDRLKSGGQRGHVGVGLLSMLGFDSTCEHLQVRGGVGRGVGWGAGAGLEPCQCFCGGGECGPACLPPW